ncbi:MAG: Terminase-like family protein [Ruminococcaceae bacterium]|nr:Terminase-like family protein [Oscillospiraceae bacterium]
MSNIIWQPQPKQRQFQERPEYEALYGGAAGGGKSDALLAEALRQVHIPHYKALILRKTYPQLAELVDRSRAIYLPAFPAARYNAQAHCWLFPSGAKIYFGSMQHTKDRTNYQGKAYDFIGFDELTHFTFDEYSYMFSRNRPTGPGTRVYIRATTNPGGIGHSWVKQRFITAAPPLTPIKDSYLVPSPQGKTLKIEKSRIFVPSNIFDNKKLLENDPQYLASLAMLPEAEKNALLYGSWDSFEGQVFSEWRNDPEHYEDEKWTHVIKPFRIPSYWRIWRGFDFGYQKPFSVGWYAASPEGMLYRIREYYGCDGTPNHGLQMNMADVAAQILRIESEDENLRGRKIAGIADPSIFDVSRGESIADIMAKGARPVFWEPGDNHRIAGKMQYHYRLAFDEEGTPRFQVFDTCRHFIRTIPNLVYSKSDVEDIDTTQEDHIYDECRYVLMANPITPRQTERVALSRDDPLNLKQAKKPARFFRI